MTCLPPSCGRALVLSSVHPLLIAAAILGFVVLYSIFIAQRRSIGLLLPCDLDAANTRRQYCRVICDGDLLAVRRDGTHIHEPWQMENDILRSLLEVIV